MRIVSILIYLIPRQIMQPFCMLYNSHTADLVREGNFSFKSYPPGFALSIFDWLSTWSSSDTGMYSLTYVELTLALVHLGQISFPFQPSDVKAGRMDILALSTSRFTKPTLAYLLKCVRSVFLAASRYFGWESICFDSKAKIELGLFRPCDGVVVKLPTCILKQIRQLTIQFFSTRPYRTVADLARPI